MLVTEVIPWSQSHRQSYLTLPIEHIIFGQGLGLYYNHKINVDTGQGTFAL